MIKISKPNTKTHIESFNIHNNICKTIKGCKTQGCLKHCYYNKIIRIYPQQEKFLNDNLRETKKVDFVHNMVMQISDLNIRYFRIHSCGEFYNQTYFNKWVNICKHFPNITFYTYTKNIDLDVKRPKNFILYISDDLGIWKSHYKRFDGVSRVKNKADKLPENFILCRNQTNNLSCLQCKACFIGKKTKICFNKH